MTARVNGYVIHSKKDFQDFVSELEKRWGRRLSTSALTFLYSQFEPFLKTETEAPLSPEDYDHNLTIAENLQKRRQKLQEVWREREKERFLRGHG